MSQASRYSSTNLIPRSSPLIEDERFASARKLLMAARDLRDRAKVQADRIGTFEGRFGPLEIQHLAGLLDDLWSSADNLVTDLEERES